MLHVLASVAFNAMVLLLAECADWGRSCATAMPRRVRKVRFIHGASCEVDAFVRLHARTPGQSLESAGSSANKSAARVWPADAAQPGDSCASRQRRTGYLDMTSPVPRSHRNRAMDLSATRVCRGDVAFEDVCVHLRLFLLLLVRPHLSYCTISSIPCELV
jgi:hypothetical protein